MKLLNKVFLILVLFSNSVFAADFIEGMDDIPLMNGTKQIQSSSISFGNDESRFDEAYITSKKLSFSKISKFYQNTLPQLGWKFINSKEKALHFERDMEVLDIALERGKPILIRITIKSKD